jgi:predicted NAD/FAD-binding protein
MAASKVSASLQRNEPVKIAIVGSGISGIAAAHLLQNPPLSEQRPEPIEVVIFEADGRIGGHTDTHAILVGGRSYAVDSGFIIFNRDNYPLFSAWLDELGVASQPTNMSFGVRNAELGIEYGTQNLNALISQRRNAFSPRFLRMLHDLRRFYREAQALDLDETVTLGQLVRQQGYRQGFVRDHLWPMCAALWSLPLGSVEHVPAAHVVAFMAHHKLLQLHGRPEWRVVQGGSARYVDAFLRAFRGEVRLNEPVHAISRRPDGVIVRSRSGERRFDAVVMACHSDQSLALLADPSTAEREILAAIGYQPNKVVVHSDPRVMPHSRRAWSSWNGLVNGAAEHTCQVSYWMNRLQGLSGPTDFFVTLNPTQPLTNVWCRRHYSHPVFTAEARMAQRRRHEINGVNNTYYCGAYWGWGFHEDGFASALDVVRLMRGGLADAA